MLRSEFEQHFREACKVINLPARTALRSFYTRLKILRESRRASQPTYEQVIMESGIPRTASRRLVDHLNRAIGERIRIEYVAREM